MNRLTLALLTALEAVVIVAIGLAVPLLVGGVVWGAELGFSGDVMSVWRAVVDVWLLGHGVPITIGLDAATMTTLGVPEDLGVFVLSLAPLGFALGTVLAAVRTGRRCVEQQWVTVIPVGTLVVAVVSVLLASTANVTGAGPSMPVAAIAPAGFYLLGAVIGVLLSASRGDVDAVPVLERAVERIRGAVPAEAPIVLRAAVRTTGVFLVIMTGLAALGFLLALLSGYSTIVSLYESTEYGVVGGIIVTLVHLAYLPTLLVWSASWLLGPGFALGTGTLVAPIATQLGPLPAVPVLGAVPQWNAPLGLLVVILPVAAGALAAALARRRASAEDATAVAPVPVRVAVVVTSAALSALVVLIVAALAAGSIGPGVLADVGPAPWAVAGCAALAVLAGGAVAWVGPVKGGVAGASGR
ncbi:DUF6350 family protein [Mycetocola reblochoni]|uniref:Possible membrane protein related to de Novo purine biosynthesis n=1 Tax=Mycetocola reblochoni REB411 TaxID=1255698 RepID=A0A1R4KAU5_9MICO|nr:DUF6350 family protein [Mycetocola reblochoni]SJN41531.1 Possible membrane protein related to de Novo purine biosynthesis [Mycetocola reblochoni REB411]